VAYVWLAAGGLLLAGWVLFRRRDPVAVAVFWFAQAAIFTANYAVLDLMEMYHYRPGLLSSLIADTALGVYLAELGFLAGWALWVVYNLPMLSGTIIGTGVVVAIEWLFRRWGIFIGHQWQLWHTAVTFPPFFLLVYWFRDIAERHGVTGGWVRIYTRVNLALWWSHFFGMVAYWIAVGLAFRIRVLPTFARNQTLGAILTVGPFLIAATLWVMVAGGRERITRLVWSTAGLWLIGQFWVSTGLWQFRAPWNVYVHTAAQIATIYLAALCDDWIHWWTVTRIKST